MSVHPPRIDGCMSDERYKLLAFIGTLAASCICFVHLAGFATVPGMLHDIDEYTLVVVQIPDEVIM